MLGKRDYPPAIFGQARLEGKSLHGLFAILELIWSEVVRVSSTLLSGATSVRQLLLLLASCTADWASLAPVYFGTFESFLRRTRLPLPSL